MRADRLIFLVTMARISGYILYGLAVLFIVHQIIGREPGSDAPRATHRLAADHKVAVEDLTTDRLSGLIGHYTRQEIDPNKPVTPDMVSRDPLPSDYPNTIAAIVTVPRTLLADRKIVEGTPVIVTRAGQPIDGLGLVLKLDCDEQRCMAVVRLPKMASQTVDPDAFKTLDILPVPLIPDAK